MTRFNLIFFEDFFRRLATPIRGKIKFSDSIGVCTRGSKLDYYLRLLSNLNENTLVLLAVPHLLAVLGFLTCGMMLYLSVLVFRANPQNAKNRFLSFLLAFEGLGAAALNFFGLYPFRPEHLDALFSIRYVSGATGVLLIMFYVCIFTFYTDRPGLEKVRLFFASRWIWFTPLLGVIVFMSAVAAAGGNVSALGDMYALECTKVGDGETSSYGGTEFPFDSTCPAPLASVYPLTIMKISVGTLQPIIVPLLALSLLVSTIYLYRIDLNSIDEDSSFDASEIRAVRIGFLAKLIFSVGATILIILADSLLKSGVLMGSDVRKDSLFMSLFHSTTLFMNIFGSFMLGVLFAYAILKQDVLGIDEQLRKTFTGTIFAGLGAILFITGTEIMESIAGVGWVGAVGMGSVLYVTRKPILTTISSVSNRLLPEAHTKEEQAYLELYKFAMQDGFITEKERAMLVMQAKNYGLSETRMEYLESWHDENSLLQIDSDLDE